MTVHVGVMTMMMTVMAKILYSECFCLCLQSGWRKLWVWIVFGGGGEGVGGRERQNGSLPLRGHNTITVPSPAKNNHSIGSVLLRVAPICKSSFVKRPSSSQHLFATRPRFWPQWKNLVLEIMIWAEPEKLNKFAKTRTTKNWADCCTETRSETDQSKIRDWSQTSPEPEHHNQNTSVGPKTLKAADTDAKLQKDLNGNWHSFNLLTNDQVGFCRIPRDILVLLLWE